MRVPFVMDWFGQPASVDSFGWLWGRWICEGLTDLLFPPSCLLCHQEVDLPFHRPLYCRSCQSRVVMPLGHACYRCAIRLPFKFEEGARVPMVPRERTRKGCPDCRQRKWAFDRVVAVGSYEGRWREHVYQLKRPHHSADAYQAGKLLGEQLLRTEWWPEYDCLVPLPIHWRRHWMRGFNQSLAIALGMRAVLQWPVFKRALRADRYTQKQGTLQASARSINVQRAMQPGAESRRLQGRRVLLVDDVLTTGATMNMAARWCRRAGARQVAVAVVARAGRI